VSLRHSLFKADVAEHRPLEVLVPSHLARRSCSGVASDPTGQLVRFRGIFQRPAKWFVPHAPSLDPASIVKLESDPDFTELIVVKGVAQAPCAAVGPGPGGRVQCDVCEAVGAEIASVRGKKLESDPE
jgi:hypothetical protein